MEYSASLVTALGLEYNPGLLTSAALVESLSRVLAHLQLVDAPLAREIRRTGAAVAHGIAAARLAARGQAARHHRRARAQATTLIAQLESTWNERYHIVTGRRETIAYANRIIRLIDAKAC